MQKEASEQIVKRLRRSAGQLKAVERMIENEKDPKAVLIQLAAVIASLENAKITIVEEYTKQKILESVKGLSELLK